MGCLYGIRDDIGLSGVKVIASSSNIMKREPMMMMTMVVSSSTYLGQYRCHVVEMILVAVVLQRVPACWLRVPPRRSFLVVVVLR